MRHHPSPTPVLYSHAAAVLALFVASSCCLLFASCSGDDVKPLLAHPQIVQSGADLYRWVYEAESRIASDLLVAASPVLGRDDHLIHAIKTTVDDSASPYYRLVIFNTASGETRKATVDERGVLVDLAAVVSSARTRSASLYGNLAPQLYAQVVAQPAKLHEVRIVYNHPLIPLMPDAALPCDYASYDAQVAATVKNAGDPVVADLHAHGGSVLARGVYAPYIEASVLGSELLNHYAAHPDVTAVSASLRNIPQVLVAAQSTADLNLNPVFYSLGYYGSNVRVGITESAGANCRIAFDHPFLVFPVENAKSGISCTSDPQCSTCDAGRCRAGWCTAWHTTMVAGMVGHSAVWLPREAPLASLYHANQGTSHSQDLDWLAQNSAYIENESWMGGYTDVWAQDWYSAVQGTTILEAAGNAPSGQSGVNYEASCHASNTICVASYNNLTTFSDFTNTKNLSTCSRWTSGCDREEPQVTFHGGGATSTTNDPNDSDFVATADGTSFATPAATGLTALLYQRWPSPFYRWPEVVRAAMMASADRDVLVPVPGKTYSDYQSPDERDGAGVPNATRIQAMQNAGRITRHILDKNTSFDQYGKKIMATVQLNANQRLRAVLAWRGCPTPTPPNSAHADFDLHIISPQGIILANAASYDGTYEIAEIVAPVMGSYFLEIEYFGWQYCSPYGGWWTQAGFAYDVR